MTEDQMTQLADKAHALVKDLGLAVHKGCYMDMSSITLSPSHVHLTSDTKEIRGTVPRAKDFDGPEKQAAYRAAITKWKADALARADQVFPQGLERLKKAKIKVLKIGREYGWPIAKLA